MLTPEPTNQIAEDDPAAPQEELKVTFYPELYLQRRIWILNVLRKENITRVLDVGCGEGQLLTVLAQPAPWLTPPPPSILPPPADVVPGTPLSPTYNDDEVPNLHATHVYGLDISAADLAFAVQGTAPPPPPEEGSGEEEGGFRSYYAGAAERWEELVVRIWRGGLEVVNEEFVGVECIVSTEVIEHLPPPLFPFFAPVLLGVYHPRFLLVTTPSYTYNARFTAPHSPPSTRKGFPDPTGRTGRIFRHDDHHFEWTAPEFAEWCTQTAGEWRYEVEVATIGRAVEPDPYGREEELGGASSVAVFRRRDSGEGMGDAERERKGREMVQALSAAGDVNRESHILLATHQHAAHPQAQRPAALPVIAAAVKAKMESFREAFMRIEELWFERDIAALCGGWIELLVRAVEESKGLTVAREGLGARTMWNVELVGGVSNPRRLWEEEGEWEGDRSADLMPPEDWTPGEGSYSSDGDEDSTEGAEGDISWGASEGDEEEDVDADVEDELVPEAGGSARGGWGAAANATWAGEESWGKPGDRGWGRMPSSASSSTAGWDGDEDESDDTTG